MNSFPDVTAFIEGMKSERDSIFGRLSARVLDLEDYLYLQCNLSALDVSKDATFQRTFNRFYKMRSKPAGWYELFFSLLERDKHRADLKFEEVICKIFSRWNEVHPSFASKMVATINPENPIYDKEICKHLGIKQGTIADPEARLATAISNFSALRTFHSAAIKTRGASDLIEAFDRQFERFGGFTSVKKIDLMMWQWRDRSFTPVPV
jgi:hypothetical protein